MNIYADNAATTKMSKTAINAMLPYFDQIYGNPSSLHCSVLAEEAVKAAIKDYYDRNGLEYDPALFPDCASCGHCSDEG